jgi:capsule polysaccharide export protein KpsE/RkpR
MATAQMRPAMSVEEVKARADLAVAAAEARLAEAQDDLADFERRMGRMGDDPSQIATTLSAKRGVVEVAQAALAAAQVAAASPPTLDPRVKFIQREEARRAELYCLVYPLQGEINSLQQRINELRARTEHPWWEISTLTRSIEARRTELGIGFDAQWEYKLAAQLEREKEETNDV